MVSADLLADLASEPTLGRQQQLADPIAAEPPVLDAAAQILR
jgi:hypothetical protein